MSRKRLTQILPWLLPLRTRQRQLFFYTALALDGNHYAGEQSPSSLPHELFHTACPLYNRETGFDMIYQENKVFNLKLAAATLDTLLIRPGETFSFWKGVQKADRFTPYKEGLIVIDGKLTTRPGGGMCQMSNLLFWLFLHTPLTIVERSGHGRKEFPEPPSDVPTGVDATVVEGWVDLKVRNDTSQTFQLQIDFTEADIRGAVFSDGDEGVRYEIRNGETLYYIKNQRVYEEVDVVRTTIDSATGRGLASALLYRNKCEIGYTLPAGTPVHQEISKEVAI